MPPATEVAKSISRAHVIPFIRSHCHHSVSTEFARTGRKRIIFDARDFFLDLAWLKPDILGYASKGSTHPRRNRSEGGVGNPQRARSWVFLNFLLFWADKASARPLRLSKQEVGQSYFVHFEACGQCKSLAG